LKNLKHHTRYGLIIGLAIAIYIGIVKGTSLKQVPVAEFGIFVLLILGIAASALGFLKANNFSTDFPSAFGNAFRTAAMAALLVVAFTMLSYVLYPQLKAEKLAAFRQQGVALNRPTAEIDKNVAEQEKNFYSLELSRTIFPLMALGSIASLLMAVITPAMGKSAKIK
jgi:hypothetical protein